MNIFQKIKNRLKYEFEKYLKKHFQFLKVERPYIIKVAPQFPLKGKIAIVTGGAGTIGRACSFRLAAEGATVYICGRNKYTLETLSLEMKEKGLNVKIKCLDVENAECIKKSFEDIANENDGIIDILVNSAGGSAREKTKEFTEQEVSTIDFLLNVNLRGAMLCAKYVAPYMKKNGGKIINITSVIGIQGKANFSEYAAAKGGSIAFVKSLAQELGQFKINVNAVSPGIVQRGEISTDALKRIQATNFLNAFGKPEDIANTVFFLCSEEASFITGQNIIVDGGRSLGLKEN